MPTLFKRAAVALAAIAALSLTALPTAGAVGVSPSNPPNGPYTFCAAWVNEAPYQLEVRPNPDSIEWEIYGASHALCQPFPKWINITTVIVHLVNPGPKQVWVADWDSRVNELIPPETTPSTSRVYHKCTGVNPWVYAVAIQAEAFGVLGPEDQNYTWFTPISSNPGNTARLLGGHNGHWVVGPGREYDC